MGEILKKCNKDGCQLCIDTELAFEDLLWRLSKIHKRGSFDSETLCKANLEDFDSENPDYKKVPELQKAIFEIAYDNILHWARLLVHEKPIREKIDYGFN